MRPLAYKLFRFFAACSFVLMSSTWAVPIGGAGAAGGAAGGGAAGGGAALGPAGTIVQVSPTLADVSSSDASNVSIRYSFTGVDLPLAGQFCSSLVGAYPPGGVVVGNPCAVPIGFVGSILNYSPLSLIASENLYVPQSVARLAYQTARRTGNSIFYFVRQFSSGRSTVVQLRLSGNAANSPVSISQVRMIFKPANQPIAFIQRAQSIPDFEAHIRYNGAGLLRGRWELVQPGDPQPSNLDLSTEASLIPQDRALQQRFRLLQAFQLYLQPNGRVTIPGPDPKLLPSDIDGQYQILLRIEATDALQPLDPTGQTASGGSAPFVLPVLRYFVGVPGTQGMSTVREVVPINLLAPAAFADTGKGSITFQWLPAGGVQFYRLEVEEVGNLVFAARVRAEGGAPGIYEAPPMLRQQASGLLTRWRIMALDAQGRPVGQSEWRGLKLNK